MKITYNTPSVTSASTGFCNGRNPRSVNLGIKDHSTVRVAHDGFVLSIRLIV